MEMNESEPVHVGFPRACGSAPPWSDRRGGDMTGHHSQGSVESPGAVGDAVGDQAELLDRDEELASLAELAANARAVQGGVICVEGRAEAGKTSLLTAWAAAE